MSIRFLAPVAMVLCVSLSFVNATEAATSCAAACGPKKPCETPCLDHGTPRHCSDIGPCQKVPDVAEPADQLTLVAAGDARCAASTTAPAVELPVLLIGWAVDAARWLEATAGRFAVV